MKITNTGGIPDSCMINMFVARQPIYDSNLKIWGYELFFRNSSQEEAVELEDPDLATASVIIDGFPLALAGLKNNRRLAINFTRKMLLDGLYDSLPPERCVADIPSQFNDPSYLNACRKLKDDGYLVAVQVPAKGELLRMADIIRFDVQRYKNVDFNKAAKQLKSLKARLLAQRIETKTTFMRLRELGFDLFQGYLFSKPVIFPGQKPNMTGMAKIRILGELADDDFDVQKLAQMISSDVGLSYRLLRFINSPYFGLKQEIASISHAISLLGQQRLRHWVMAAVLSDVCSDQRTQEIYFISLKRARLMELLAERSSKLKGNEDSLFMLGLFSMLDALLCNDMATIIQQMGLREEIAQALCGADNAMGHLLRLIEDMEEGNWDTLMPELAKYGMNMADVAISHNMAILWASEMSSNMECGHEDVA